MGPAEALRGAAVTPRDAATVVLLRDGREGPEVLMLRRHARADFAADAWVFPGGAVDEADRRLDAARWTGIEPDRLVPRFAEPADLVLGYHVACVRETFEEAGILFARHADGRPADPTSAAARRARSGLSEGTGTWAEWLARHDLVLELGELTYHSRWVTPAPSPKRFDTCFFLARAPEGQVAAHDRVETTDQSWLTPEEALTRADAGAMLIWHPTRETLEALAGAPSVAEVLADARVPRTVRPVEPGAEHLGGAGR